MDSTLSAITRLFNLSPKSNQKLYCFKIRKLFEQQAAAASHFSRISQPPSPPENVELFAFVAWSQGGMYLF